MTTARFVLAFCDWTYNVLPEGAAHGTRWLALPWSEASPNGNNLLCFIVQLKTSLLTKCDLQHAGVKKRYY